LCIIITKSSRSRFLSARWARSQSLRRPFSKRTPKAEWTGRLTDGEGNRSRNVGPHSSPSCCSFFRWSTNRWLVARRELGGRKLGARLEGRVGRRTGLICDRGGALTSSTRAPRPSTNGIERIGAPLSINIYRRLCCPITGKRLPVKDCPFPPVVARKRLAREI
jgi:hypothetical protein